MYGALFLKGISEFERSLSEELERGSWRSEKHWYQDYQDSGPCFAHIAQAHREKKKNDI